MQVYGLNYWTNMNGGWSMGNGASNDITISGNPSLANLIILNKTNYLVLGQKNDKKLIAGTDGVISVEKQITRVVDTTHKGFMLGRGYDSPVALSQQRSLKSDIHTFRLYNRTLVASELLGGDALEQGLDEGALALGQEIDAAADKHFAAQRGAEGHLLHNLALGDGHEEQAAQVNCGEERADDTYDEGGSEALDGTCTEEQQDDAGDD